ncbi:MAG: hypothetical protein RR356_03960 [Bacteroidales bacterium]
MKKIFLFSVLIALAANFLTSCKPDDEIYDPKCRISKIWYRSDVGAADEVYSYTKKQLSRIDLKDTTYYTFEYNKDQTVSKIVHKGTNYTEAMDMTYTDRLVDKITYTINGAVRLEVTFTREDEKLQKISTIKEVYDKQFFEDIEFIQKSDLYHSFMGDVEKIEKVATENNAKNLVLKCNKVITYTGDNITLIKEEYPDVNQIITTTLTYDLESYNPFFGLPYSYRDLAGYSVNNKTKEVSITRTSGFISRSVTKNYQYQDYLNDDKYPRRFITTSSENNVPINTYITYVKK